MQHKEKTDREGYKKKLWVWDQPQEERVPLNDFLFKFLWMCTYCVVWVVVDSCILLLTFTTTDTAQCITLNAFITQRNAYFGSVTNWHTSSQLYKPGCAVTAALMLWTIRNSSAKRDTYSRVKQRFPDTNSKKYFTGENSSQISPTVQLLQNDLSDVLEMLNLSHKWM